jgi:hypothetical protein
LPQVPLQPTKFGRLKTFEGEQVRVDLFGDGEGTLDEGREVVEKRSSSEKRRSNGYLGRPSQEYCQATEMF